MVKMVSIEVFIVFIIITAVIFFLLGMVLMCSFIVSADSDREGKKNEFTKKRK